MWTTRCLNKKLTRKSPQVFTYVFLIASYQRFTKKSLQVSIISCSKVIESSREDHEKLSVFIFCSKLLKVHDKVNTSFSLFISNSKVFESSWEGHHKFWVFTSLSSNKLLKVHNIATANWQYLFLAGHSKLFQIHENVGVPRTPPQFSRMLFNTQIIPHYKNTFSVRRSINQSIFCTNNYRQKSSLFVQENVRWQWLNEYPNLIILSKRQNKVSIHALFLYSKSMVLMAIEISFGRFSSFLPILFSSCLDFEWVCSLEISDASQCRISLSSRRKSRSWN